MRRLVYLLIVSSALALSALTASGQGQGANASTQGRAAATALDPELTNYEYPYPVGFYEFDTQGQRLRMAYMDLAAARPGGRAAARRDAAQHQRQAGRPHFRPQERRGPEAGKRPYRRPACGRAARMAAGRTDSNLCSAEWFHDAASDAQRDRRGGERRPAERHKTLTSTISGSHQTN